MFSLKGIPKYFPTTFHLFRNFFVTKICDYDEDPENCIPSLELEPGEYVSVFSEI